MTNRNGNLAGRYRSGTESLTHDGTGDLSAPVRVPACVIVTPQLSAEQALLGLTGTAFAPAESEGDSQQAAPQAISLPKSLAGDWPVQPHTSYSAHSWRELLMNSRYFQPALWWHYHHRLVLALRHACYLEYQRGVVFLLLTGSGGAGALHYFGLNGEPSWWQLAIPAALLALLYGLLHGSLIRRLCLAVIIIYLGGMACAKWEAQRHATAMLGSAVTTVLTAKIITMEQEISEHGKPGRWRLVADVLATQRPVLRHAPQRLRLSAADLPALAETGMVIKGTVRLRPHGGPIRSGQYDFAFHGFFRDIGGNGFFLGIPQLVPAAAVPVGAAPSWSDGLALEIAQLRAVIGGRIMQAVPGEEGAVAAALISGQRAGISARTNEALRIAGLAHILSISGLHLALAAAIVMVSARGCAGLFAALSLYYPVKKIAALISLFSAGFYLAVSGADVAAQRSFIMLAVMLTAIMLDRQALTMRNLALAAMISIIVSPHEILGPSFQMSYSATAALIAAFGWWKTYKRKRQYQPYASSGILSKLARSLSATLVTSLVAGTASGLYAAFHFNNMAPLGMLGNVLALPVISLLIMPFAVMALLVMPFGLEWLPLQVMGQGVALVKAIAQFVAALSPELIPGLLPVPVLLLWSAALLVLVFLTTMLRWLALLLFAAGFALLAATPLPDIMMSEDARVVAVRQGSTLYLNQRRVSAFTINHWKKAYRITTIILPDNGTSTRNSTSRNRPEPEAQIPGGFVCAQGLCSFDMEDGRIIAYTENAAATEAACMIAQVIIIGYAGPLACPQPDLLMAEPDQTARQQHLQPQNATNSSAETLFEKSQQTAEGDDPFSVAENESFITPDSSLRHNTATQTALQANPPIIQSLQRQYVDAGSADAKPTDSKNSVSQPTEPGFTDPQAFVAKPLDPPPLVINRQQLALKGAAEIYLTGRFEKSAPVTVFTIGTPQRPWHLYRLYSRAARNLADWK